MMKRFDSILDHRGEPLEGVSVLVLNSGGAIATIYSDDGVTTTPNPMSTDADGFFEYYAPDGVYSWVIAFPSSETKTITGVLHDDSSITDYWAVATGTGDAMVASIGGSTLDNGFVFGVRAAGANTITTPQLNVSGVGSKTIKGPAAAALVASAYASGQELLLRYNLSGDYYEWMNPSVASYVGTADAGSLYSSSTTEGNLQEVGYASRRNLFANAGCNLARTSAAVALTTTPTVSTVDGFFVFQNSAANGTSSQSASGLTGTPKALRLQRTEASASTNAILAIQAFTTVDSLPLAGVEVELSFYAKAGANYSGGAINVLLQGGTGTDESAASIGSWTGAASIIGTTQAITTTATRYTFSGTVGASVTQIGFRVFFTPSDTAGADDWMEITEFSLSPKAVERSKRIFAEDRLLARVQTPTCGRLSNLITNTGPVPGADPFDSCHFIPYNGNLIAVNGKLEVIPDGALAASGGLIANYSSCYLDKVAAQTLADNTNYFIYVCMIAGVPVLNFSTTGYSQNGPIYGNAVKNDDPSCTLVGICYIQHVSGTPTTLGGARGQTISSYFNQFRANLITAVVGPVTSATATALPGGATLANGQPTYNYLEWVQWYDNAPRTRLIANVGVNSAGATANLGIGTNSTTVISGFTGKCVVPTTADNTQNIGAWTPPTDATGYYYAQVLGYSSAGTLQADGYFEAQGVMV